MKKIFILLFVFLMFVEACAPEHNANGDEKLFSNAVIEDETATDKFVHELCLDPNVELQETVDKIILPDEYCRYDTFVAADDKWYFFADYSNSGTYKYIKINRANNLEIVPLSDVGARDFSLTYVWEESLYINFFEVGEEGCVYQVLKITEGDNPEVVLSGNSSGYPEMSFSGDNLIILTVSNEGENFLEVYNMNTCKKQMVYSSKGIQREDYTIVGTIINGLAWPRVSSSTEGFCYMVSDMNGRTFDDGQMGEDILYYYSFDTQESVKLFDHNYIADYVGGTKEVILVSDYGNMYNVGKSEKIYFYSDDGYQQYYLKYKDEGHEGFTGFGVLNNNRYIAYSGQDFLVIDACDKTYLEKKYSYAATTKDLDYTGTLREYYYADMNYYFCTLESDNLYVYTIQ